MTFLFNTRRVFISHSSKDTDVISAVDQAFDGLDSKPYLLEREITGTPPTKKIPEIIEGSDALFAFFTPNTQVGETRDWILFELGVAVAKGRKIHAWKQRRTIETVPPHSSSSGMPVEFVREVEVPRFLEQVTTYREFDPTVQGIFKLTGEIKNAAKKLYSLNF